MPDRYTYPGTEVLINLPGYTNPTAWKTAETAVVSARMFELFHTRIEGDFDLPHLQAIHRHLTQDFYAWGGVLRDTDTGPGRTSLAHCRPEFIPAEAGRIFGTLAGELNYLRDRDADEFSTSLAWVWGETTALHPFRDVNTRSQFVFFNHLAQHAGWVIDWAQIDPYVFGHARTVAIATDERGIDALLRPALVPLADITAHDRERTGETGQTFFTPRSRRTRAELNNELARAITERTRRFGAFADPFRR